MRYFPLPARRNYRSRNAEQFDLVRPAKMFLYGLDCRSLSGDEVMPLDYHAGRSGWLLYGRGLDKQRLTQWQQTGAAMVIVAAWCVKITRLFAWRVL
jgi:hypothetical protein